MKLAITLSAKEAHALASLTDFFGSRFMTNYSLSHDACIVQRLDNVTGTYKAEVSTPEKYLLKIEDLITWQYGAVFSSLANALKSLAAAYKVLAKELPKDFEEVVRKYADGAEITESETKQVSPWVITDTKTERINNEEYVTCFKDNAA